MTRAYLSFVDDLQGDTFDALAAPVLFTDSGREFSRGLVRAVNAFRNEFIEGWCSISLQAYFHALANHLGKNASATQSTPSVRGVRRGSFS